MARNFHTLLTTALTALVLATVFAPARAEALFGGRSTKASSGGEYVILSGGPALRKWENLRVANHQHDRWWGNFIRPARARIQELQKEHGKTVNITWLVYRSAYTTRANEDGEPLVSWIESVRDKYGVKLVWIDSGADVIRHINSGQNRRRTKVKMFEYYGHSNKHAFMMDYSNDISGASKSWLHERDLRTLKKSAFARDAECRSYGCHTGESMSAKWKAATGLRMWGAHGKTDYSNPLKPVVSPGGYWKY